MYDVTIVFENVTALDSFVVKGNLILSGFSKEQAMIRFQTQETDLIQSFSKSSFRESNKITFLNVKKVKDPEE